MTYEPSAETYRKNEIMMGLKTGMKITIFRSAVRRENGWKNSWPDEMNYYIGKTCEIRDTGDHEGHGIRISGYRFPYFCMKLHKVTKDDISR